MLVSLKEIMADASAKGNAVGAFNCPNLESVIAIVEAAEELGTPVVLNYAEVHGELIKMEDIGPIMLHYAKQASVPICVHLDHGESLESCMKAIRMGFTSVMIDASGQDYEENVARTAEVARIAHSVGVSVEGELGQIFAAEDDVIYTDPDMARDYAERTGVDALGIAFGTGHGIYMQKPDLDFGRITAIRNKVDIPLVMHGGSGLEKEDFRTAIQNGIRKINYYTYMTLAGGKAVKWAMDHKSPEGNIFFHDIPLIATKAMKENAKKAIEIFSLQEGEQ